MSLKAAINAAFGDDEQPRERPAAVLPVNGNGSGYGLAALANEVATVRNAQNGNRNKTLNNAAVKLGHLVAGGELDEAQVIRELTAAGRYVGLTEREIPRTIRSGLNKGMQEPRQAPVRWNGGPVALEDLTPPDDTDFWSARPELEIIRDTARERLVSPWATFGAVLALVCSRIGPHVVLPPIIGGHASLNSFWALVGPSGAGKDAALAVAEELLWLNDSVPTHEVGTGQGIDSSYTTQTKKGPVQFCDAALFTVTEVDTLAGHAGMRGSTLMPTLRKVYSGSALGARYADKDRRRPVRAHRYRAALIGGVQPARAGVLLADADGGTPQRWLWLPTNDPAASSWKSPPEVIIKPRRPLWQQFESLQAYGETEDDSPVPMRRRVELTVCETARMQVVTHRRQRLAAPLAGEPEDLASHALLTRLKVAALLALLDSGRTEVSDQDWRLSGVVMGVSDATRALCKKVITDQQRKMNIARAQAEIERTEVVAEHAVKRVAAALIRQLRRRGDWVGRSELRRTLRGADRQHFEAGLDRLQSAGQIDEEESDRGTKYRAREC